MAEGSAEQAQALVLQALAALGPQPRSTAVLARRLEWPQSRLLRVLSDLDGSTHGPALVQAVSLAGPRGPRTGWQLGIAGWALFGETDAGRARIHAIPGEVCVPRTVWRRQDAVWQVVAQADAVVDEAPVALLYNGHPHTVMMATPTDLEDFALGYSLAEAIVDRLDRIQLVEIVRQDRGCAVHLAVDAAAFATVQALGRTQPGSASCGLCGSAELAAALSELPSVPTTPERPSDAVLDRLQAGLDALQQAQRLNRRTGGVHAAGLLQADGQVLVREDIGRHSAVDKVIGAAARAGVPCDTLLLTSRLSYEIVRKAARVGVHTLAALSAPSALALQQAHVCGMQVWAFVRAHSANHYPADPAAGEHLKD